MGNRLKKTAGSTTSYTYDCMNRLTSATGMGFDWDKNGNMVYMHDGSDAWNYTYDLEDRLTSVRENGAMQNRFWYDADGRRVRLWDSQDGYLIHVYSGLDVIYESSSSGVTKHFYANGLHIAEMKPGGGSIVTEYYHQDHLGSTRLKTDADGDIVFTRNYEPFGPDYDGSGSEEFKYTGKHEDPSGLYYYGARYYDPETGRFITEDPVTGSIDDPQGLNQYVYCRNNPQKYTDPNGKWIHVAAGAAAGFIIGFGMYLFSHPGEIKGALVHGVIGAGVGAVTTATFGATALALTPKEPLVVAAMAGLGAKGTVVAGAVSGGVGGVMERCLEGIAHNLDLPGQHEAPTFKLESFIPDVAGGVIGQSAGYGTGIIGLTIPKIRTALDIVIITGEVTEEYAALVIIESTVSEFMSRQTEYLSSRLVFEPQPYHDILPEPWD